MDSLVSVIVPVYNVEAFLDECIKSVVVQTYENWELILVNDGSKDNSPKICDQWADKDERIKVFHQENGGLSEARNAGLKHCKGEYIVFLDSDDYLMPNGIEYLLEKLEDEGCQMCVGNYNNIFGDEVYMGTLNQSIHEEILDWEGYMERFYTFVPFYAQVWAKIYKREIFEDILFPKGRVSEDAYVMLDVVRKCERICIVPEVVSVYRQRQGSVTARPYSETVDDDVLWLDKHIGFYRENGYTNLEAAAIKQYCYMLLQRWGELDSEKKRKYSSVLRKNSRYIFVQKNVPAKTRVKYGVASVSPSLASSLFRNRRRR